VINYLYCIDAYYSPNFIFVFEGKKCEELGTIFNKSFTPLGELPFSKEALLRKLWFIKKNLVKIKKENL
jgi:hypothetical protein